MASSRADCVFGVVRLISSASRTLVKTGSALEFKLLLDGGVDRDTQDIGGQHVAGELHSLKAAVEGPGQSLAKSSLADAGNAFDQQVSASQERNQREPDNIVLAANDLARARFPAAARDGTRQ